MSVSTKSPKPYGDLRRCPQTHSWTGYSLARCSSAVLPPLHRTSILYRIGRLEQATGNVKGALKKTEFQTKKGKNPLKTHPTATAPLLHKQRYRKWELKNNPPSFRYGTVKCSQPPTVGGNHPPCTEKPGTVTF